MHNPSDYFPPQEWPRLRATIGFLAANWRGVEGLVALLSLIFGLSAVIDPHDVFLSCEQLFLPPWAILKAWPFLLAGSTGFAGIACNILGIAGCRILRFMSGFIVCFVGILVCIGLLRYGLTGSFAFYFFASAAVLSVFTMFLAFLNLPPPGWREGCL